MKERFLLTISFILCIFSGWALVQAQPVEDFQFTNETYNSSDWDTLFQNSLSSSNLSSWNANVYDNYLELQAAWEENIDSQIDSYLFSVFQSDDYNPNENYLDYALTYLNSKKETSFLEWETSTLSRIETERTNYLNLISGYNLSDPLQTLWNDWVGSFENHLEVGMGEFNSALTELNENYNEILNEIQTTDQNFLVNEYRISEYENLVRNAVQGQLNSLKVHVLTNSLLQQKYNFLDDKGNLLPQFQYNGDLFKFSNSDITKDWGLQDYLDDYTKLKDSKFGLKSLIAGQWGQDFVENNSHDYLLNSNGKELFNLINELEQGLENKLPLSEISNKLNDYFKTQKQSAEQLTSYYNSRIYTDINTSDPNSINYLTMPVSDYKLTIGKNFNPLQPEQNPTLDLSKIIREYIDGGRQDSSTLINFLNSTLASPTLSVTDLTDVDLIAYTDPSRLYTNWNMISLDRLGGKYTPDNFDRPEGDSPLFELIQFRTDGTHFYSYEYVGNLCWGYCVGSSESIDEDLVIISLKYKIKDKNALEMRNTWNDYTRDLSSQITLWEDSINPSLSTWETKVSEYKKQWEDWKTRKLTLLSQAEDELAVQTQEILNKRDTWINNSYEYFQNNFQSDNPENQFNYESIDLSTVNKELEKTTKNFGNFKDVSKANFHSKETETDLFVYIENSLSGISNFSYAESITEGLKSTENSIISSYADSLRNTRTLKDGLNQDQLSIFNKKIFEEKYINSLCGKSSEYNLSYNESDTIISCSNGSKKELKNSLAGLCINEDQNKSRCQELLNSNEYGTYKYENIEISGDTLIITQRIKDGTAYSQSSLEVNPENFTMGTELVKTSIKLGTTSMNTNGLTGLFESNWSDLRTGGTDLPKTDNKNPGLLYFQSQFDDSALEEYITLLEEQKRINELKNGDDYDNGESALSNLFNSFKDNFGYKDDENNYIQGEFTSNFNRAFLSAVSPLESLNIANIKTAENFIKNQTTWAQRVFSYFVNVVGGGLDPSMWIQNEINNIVVEKISIELKRLYPGIDLGLIKLILSDRTNSQTRNQANNELDSRLFNSMIYSPFITAPINTDYSFLQNKMPDEVGSFLRNFVSESLDLSGKFVNVDFSDTIRNIKGKDLTPFLYQGLVDYKAEVSNYIRNQSYENLSGILGREWNLDPKLISTVWKELDHRREQERIDEAKRRQNLQTFVQVATMIALQAFPGIGQVVGSYLFPSFSFSTSLGQGIVAAGSGLLQASIASSSGDSNTTSAAFVNGLFSVLGGNQGLLSNYALNLNYTPPESSNTLGGNLDLFINRFLYNNDSNSGYGGGVTYGSSRLNFGMNYAPNSGVELTLGGLVDKLFEGGFYNYSYNLDSGFSNFTIGAGAEYSSNLGVNLSSNPDELPSFFLGWGCDEGSKDGLCSNPLFNTNTGGIGGSLSLSLDGTLSFGVDVLQNELGTYSYNSVTGEHSFLINDNWQYEWLQMNSQNTIDQLENDTIQQIADSTNKDSSNVELGLITLFLLGLGFSFRTANRYGDGYIINEDPLLGNKENIKTGLENGEDINNLIQNELKFLNDDDRIKLIDYTYGYIQENLKNIYLNSGEVEARNFIQQCETSGNWHNNYIENLNQELSSIIAFQEAKKIIPSVQSLIKNLDSDPGKTMEEINNLLNSGDFPDDVKDNLTSLSISLIKDSIIQANIQNGENYSISLIMEIGDKIKGTSFEGENLPDKLLFELASFRLTNLKNNENILDIFNEIKNSGMYNNQINDLERIVYLDVIKGLRNRLNSDTQFDSDEFLNSFGNSGYYNTLSSQTINEIEIYSYFIEQNSGKLNESLRTNSQNNSFEESIIGQENLFGSLTQTIESNTPYNLILERLNFIDKENTENINHSNILDSLRNSNSNFSSILSNTKLRINENLNTINDIDLKKSLLNEADRIGMDKQISALLITQSPKDKYLQIINANNAAGSPLSDVQINQIYLEYKLKKISDPTKAYESYLKDLSDWNLPQNLDENNAQATMFQYYENEFKNKINKLSSSVDIIKQYDSFSNFINNSALFQSYFNPSIYKDFLKDKINETLLNSAIKFGDKSIEYERLKKVLYERKDKNDFINQDLLEFYSNSKKFLEAKKFNDLLLQLNSSNDIRKTTDIFSILSDKCSNSLFDIEFKNKLNNSLINKFSSDIEKILKKTKSEEEAMKIFDKYSKFFSLPSPGANPEILNSLNLQLRNQIQSFRKKEFFQNLQSSLILENKIIDTTKSLESANSVFQLFEGYINLNENSLGFNENVRNDFLLNTPEEILSLASNYFSDKASADNFFYSLIDKFQIWNVEHTELAFDLNELKKKYETNKLIYEINNSTSIEEAIEKFNIYLRPEYQNYDKNIFIQSVENKLSDFLNKKYSRVNSQEVLSNLENDIQLIQDNNLFSSLDIGNKWNKIINYNRAKIELLSNYYSSKTSSIINQNQDFINEMKNTPEKIKLDSTATVEERYNNANKNIEYFITNGAINLNNELNKITNDIKNEINNLNELKINTNLEFNSLLDKFPPNTNSIYSVLGYNSDTFNPMAEEIKKEFDSIKLNPDGSFNLSSEMQLIVTNFLSKEEQDKLKDLSIQPINSETDLKTKQDSIISFFTNKFKLDIYSIENDPKFLEYKLQPGSDNYNILALKFALNKKLNTSIDSTTKDLLTQQGNQERLIKQSFQDNQNFIQREGILLGLLSDSKGIIKDKDLVKLNLIKESIFQLQSSHEERRDNLIIKISAGEKLKELAPELLTLSNEIENELKIQNDNTINTYNRDLLNLEINLDIAREEMNKLEQEKNNLYVEIDNLKNLEIDINSSEFQTKFAELEERKILLESKLNTLKDKISLQENDYTKKLTAKRNYLYSILRQNNNSTIQQYDLWNSFASSGSLDVQKPLSSIEIMNQMRAERINLSDKLKSLNLNITPDFKLTNLDGTKIPEIDLVNKLGDLTKSLGGLDACSDLSKLWIVNTYKFDPAKNMYTARIGECSFNLVNNASNTPDKIIGLNGNVGSNGKIWQNTALAMQAANIDSITIGHVDYGSNSHVNGTSFDIWNITPIGGTTINCDMSAGQEYPSALCNFDNAFMSLNGTGKIYNPWKMWDETAGVMRENQIWEWKEKYPNEWASINLAASGGDDLAGMAVANRLFGKKFEELRISYSPGMDFAHRHHLHYDVQNFYRNYSQWSNPI